MLIRQSHSLVRYWSGT